MSVGSTRVFMCLVLRGFKGSCSRMAKRKQARPSRPSGSSAPANDNVLSEHVENEEEGELAAVREDAEQISGVPNGVRQAARRNSRKRGRFKNSLGNFCTRAFHVVCELPARVHCFKILKDSTRQS